jgi:hypothetical protein
MLKTYLDTVAANEILVWAEAGGEGPGLFFQRDFQTK